jgi:hypothetical protein
MQLNGTVFGNVALAIGYIAVGERP